MVDKTDLVALIRDRLPAVYNLISPVKLDQWAKGVIQSKTYDQWFADFQKNGVTQQLLNKITGFVNEPSIGYNTADKKQVLGAQYRTYLGIAQDALQQSKDELKVLQAQLSSAVDPLIQQAIQLQISIQQKTISAQQANVNTWQGALDAVIKSGQAV